MHRDKKTFHATKKIFSDCSGATKPHFFRSWEKNISPCGTDLQLVENSCLVKGGHRQRRQLLCQAFVSKVDPFIHLCVGNKKTFHSTKKNIFGLLRSNETPEKQLADCEVLVRAFRPHASRDIIRTGLIGGTERIGKAMKLVRCREYGRNSCPESAPRLIEIAAHVAP